MLRTGVRFASVDKPLRTLMVTSSGPSEGKSVTIANLAVVFAESGQRVLLVDSDLRRPVQHRVFKVSNFQGSQRCDSRCHACCSKQRSGDRRRQPFRPDSRAISHPTLRSCWHRTAWEALIEALKEQFDLVLFDSPPALVVADGDHPGLARRWRPAGHRCGPDASQSRGAGGERTAPGARQPAGRGAESCRRLGHGIRLRIRLRPLLPLRLSARRRGGGDPRKTHAIARLLGVAVAQDAKAFDHTRATPHQSSRDADRQWSGRTPAIGRRCCGHRVTVSASRSRRDRTR